MEKLYGEKKKRPSLWSSGRRVWALVGLWSSPVFQRVPMSFRSPAHGTRLVCRDNSCGQHCRILSWRGKKTKAAFVLLKRMLGKYRKLLPGACWILTQEANANASISQAQGRHTLTGSYDRVAMETDSTCFCSSHPPFLPTWTQSPIDCCLGNILLPQIPNPVTAFCLHLEVSFH